MKEWRKVSAVVTSGEEEGRKPPSKGDVESLHPWSHTPRVKVVEHAEEKAWRCLCRRGQRGGKENSTWVNPKQHTCS